MEEIIPYLDALFLLARIVVVVSEKLYARGRVSADIVCKRHVLDHRPGSSPFLIARREDDDEPGLPIDPTVLEHIAVNEHALSVL